MGEVRRSRPFSQFTRSESMIFRKRRRQEFMLLPPSVHHAVQCHQWYSIQDTYCCLCLSCLYVCICFGATKLCDHTRQVSDFLLLGDAFLRSQSMRKNTENNFHSRSCCSESSRLRAQHLPALRLRWYISSMPFSWKQNTWCGKHIPLSCPLPYLAQSFLYTVIAPKCIVFP